MSEGKEKERRAGESIVDSTCGNPCFSHICILSVCKKPRQLWQYYPRLVIQGCRKILSLSFMGIFLIDFKG